MKYDIFFSLSQTEVSGYTPNTKTMFSNFLDQAILADELDFQTAWIAETHLSCQTQKKTSLAVVKDFKGEIGVNSDILQLAPLVFSRTKKINVGSAIRNILCNGGPIAHAESVKHFMALHEVSEHSERQIELGFAAGRFNFSNAPFGVYPRDEIETMAWNQIKARAFEEATEIFLKLLLGQEISSTAIPLQFLDSSDFQNKEEWRKIRERAKEDGKLTQDERIQIKKFFTFEIVSLIPLDVSFDRLTLTLGSHDPRVQELCNEYLPVRVFNLSITPSAAIEKTHERMKEIYHKSGGVWQRWFMPRTCMIFIDDSPGASEAKKELRAKEKATRAWENYWRAMAGTIDPQKVKDAVDNAVYGSPEMVAERITQHYHPYDRLMLWFDFNNHDNDDVKKTMKAFREKAIPRIESYSD